MFQRRLLPGSLSFGAQRLPYRAQRDSTSPRWYGISTSGSVWQGRGCAVRRAICPETVVRPAFSLPWPRPARRFSRATSTCCTRRWSWRSASTSLRGWSVVFLGRAGSWHACSARCFVRPGVERCLNGRLGASADAPSPPSLAKLTAGAIAGFVFHGREYLEPTGCHSAGRHTLPGFTHGHLHPGLHDAPHALGSRHVPASALKACFVAPCCGWVRWQRFASARPLHRAAIHLHAHLACFIRRRSSARAASTCACEGNSMPTGFWMHPRACLFLRKRIRTLAVPARVEPQGARQGARRRSGRLHNVPRGAMGRDDPGHCT